LAPERGAVLSDGPKVGVGRRPSRGGSARRNRRTPEPRTTASGTRTGLRAYVCNFSCGYWLVRVCGTGLCFGEVRERIFLRLTHGVPCMHAVRARMIMTSIAGAGACVRLELARLVDRDRDLESRSAPAGPPAPRRGPRAACSCSCSANPRPRAAAACPGPGWQPPSPPPRQRFQS
jgi:hypothetical protein